MKSSKTNSPQETVLLRHARPKYEYKGKRLDKKINSVEDSVKESQTKGHKTTKEPTQITTPLSPTPKVSSTTGYTSQISQVQHGLLPQGGPAQEITHQPQQNTSHLNQNQHFADHNTRTKSAGVVAPRTVSQSIQLPQKPIQIIGSVQGAAARAPAASNHVGVASPSAAILKLEQELGLVRPSKEEVEKLRKENEHLKQDLDVQIKVNSELKKLLVASVGEDLERRVERLARDKAELSNEVGGFSKKVNEDYENLDKISIQADMWRSKFLASRVMIDELASARAFYSLQYQESQDALQQLLTERHELRANLLEMFKCLQQVKGAFDPLNAHKSVSLPSTNVIDLARNSQQLAEAIRYRLLPGQLNVHTVLDIDDQLVNSRTPAEIHAEEVVARQTSLDPVHKSVSGNLFGPAGSQVERYHPDARFDNLTMNCCAQCKGEISIL